MISPLPRLFFTFLAALLVGGCASASKPALQSVASVDLDRYMGRWYVISNVPYFLEKNKVASYDTYARRADGTLSNQFTFREKSFAAPEKTWEGTARVIDAGNATWKVRFIWPLSSTYRILALDPDYRWAVVSNDNATLMWVLARERHLAPDTYARILADLRLRDLPVDKLVPVPQPAG